MSIITGPPTRVVITETQPFAEISSNTVEVRVDPKTNEVTASIMNQELLYPTPQEQGFSTLRQHGVWMNKVAPTIDGTVLDERRGLGTLRDPQPMRCLEWNGTNQYAWIPVDPVTAFPFTLFGWARTTIEASSYLFSLAGTTSSNIKISFAPQRLANTARLVRGNTTEFVTDITVGNLLNEWKSYVLIFQSSTTVSRSNHRKRHLWYAVRGTGCAV
jgi:hypothetical protein